MASVNYASVADERHGYSYCSCETSDPRYTEACPYSPIRDVERNPTRQFCDSQRGAVRDALASAEFERAGIDGGGAAIGVAAIQLYGTPRFKEKIAYTADFACESQHGGWIANADHTATRAKRYSSIGRSGRTEVQKEMTLMT